MTQSEHGAAKEPRHIVIKGARVWRGGKAAIGVPGTEALDILVSDGKIAAVGAPGSGEFTATPGAFVIDGAGCTVVPGLINAHTHITMDGSPDPDTQARKDGPALVAIKAAQAVEKSVRAGITTIRDLGGGEGIDFAVRQGIRDGVITGPRLLVSGQVICMTGGHGHFMGFEADGPDEARKGARSQLKAGADVVKVMATGGVMTPGVEPGSPQMTEEEMAAAIEEAHKAGKRTATHAQGTTGIKNAIRAGVDSIEHGIYLDDEAIDMMIERGVYFVPTLAAVHHIVKGGVAAGIPEFAVRKAQAVEGAHYASFDRALKKGVKIAAGTDAGTPLNLHGDLVIELELMVERGMSLEQALRAATLVSAEACGLSDVTGSIEPGKSADLLMVSGDPLANVSALRDVRAVVSQGKVIVNRT